MISIPVGGGTSVGGERMRWRRGRRACVRTCRWRRLVGCDANGYDHTGTHRMLHIATVHYKSPRWIEIQASYLRRYLSVPYQTWTSLEGIEPSYSAFFDHVLEQRGPHAGKLNHLAHEICHMAADEDLIMFLDGDAFPIADPIPIIADSLERAPLVAVRRAENLN